MRIGVFGGSFDPIHYGHLLLAEQAREQLALDEVRFLPAATAPHKQHRAAAPEDARVEMLRLAIGGHEAFVNDCGADSLSTVELVLELEEESRAFLVDTRELDRGGVSYTVDTLREMREEAPDCELFLLLGGDSLADLPNWREPEQICRLAIPVVAARPGFETPDFGALRRLVDAKRLKLIEEHVVRMPLIELSSSDIRRRVAAGQSIRFQTPRAVEMYIAANGLYG